jgi:FAD:protein FMN transferase
VSGAAHRFPFQAMGTACCFEIFADNEAAARRAAQEGAREVYRLEGKYSRYDPDSDLSALNAVAGKGGEALIDAETADLIDLAFEWHRQSGGLFDITSGVLRRLWHFDMRRLPVQTEIAEVLAACGLFRLHWERPKLGFPSPGMEIDLGGIVKEYACDRAAETMLRFGARAVMADLGGDIRVAGERPDGAGWSIGIRRPGRTDAVGSISLSQGGLATSGNYERVFEVEGQRYSHVLDPQTGWPVESLASVSILAGTCLEAGRQSTLALLKGQDGSAWLEANNASFLAVDETGAAFGPLLSNATKLLKS